MNMKLHEWIKSKIDTTPGLTQKGLAEATGLNPATVNRMLYGRRHIRAEEVPLIEKYLGCNYTGKSDNRSEYTQPSNSSIGAFSDNISSQHFITRNNIAHDIPVYYSTYNKDSNSLFLNKSKIVDWVERHPNQRGNDSAFALYVTTDKFEPRYYMGELIYVHSGRPPATAQDCLLKKHDVSVILARYMGQSEGNILLSSLEVGRGKFTVALSEIEQIYSVVGRS